MQRYFSRSKGQVTVEVAVLFGVVVAALVAMAAYVQRGVAGGMRSNADSFGTQYQVDKPFEVHTRSTNVDAGGSTKSTQKTAACQGLGSNTIADANDPNCNATTATFSNTINPCPGSQTLNIKTGDCS